MSRLSLKGADTNGEAAARVPAYEGRLQGIAGGAVIGWVWDPEDSHRHVPVAVVVDGEIAAEGCAEIQRADLLEQGIGDGGHGFLVRLPELLQTPARHKLLVLAGSERAPLLPSPSFWQEPAADGSWSDVVFEPGGSLSAAVLPPPERPRSEALVEADGWLYSLEDEQLGLAGGEERLEQLVELLSANASRCRELGIDYVPALVPSKRTVLLAAGQDQREWVAALVARLRDLDHVELLDLLGVLRDAARHGAPYHRTDADWNDRGAFFVARALLKEAHKREPALCPPALADLHLRAVPAYRGALADATRVRRAAEGLIPCERDVESEAGVAIDPSRLHALRMPIEQHLAQAAPLHLRVYARPECDEQARVAVVGDAAALSLVPWLAERTRRTTFFWADALPLVALELELPRIVFQLVRETDLVNPPAAHGDVSLIDPPSASDGAVSPTGAPDP
jgi:hypothetical protein